MSNEINVLVIFEFKAILAGTIRDWSLFDQVGTCFIPQVVSEELEFLCKRSPDPQEEKIAREFSRFMPDSGWRITQSLVDHPSFNPSNDENLSKNALLKQAICQSVYGLAQENQDKLVVFVSNQQTLRSDIDALNINNICSLPLAQFIQWIRTKQSPINVSNKMQKMIQEGVTYSEVTNIKSTVSPPVKTKNSSLNNDNSTNKTKNKSAKKTNIISVLISSILTIMGFSFVGLVLWYFIQPNSFNKFLEKNGLSPLPTNFNK
jgi:hypothetical protein